MTEQCLVPTVYKSPVRWSSFWFARVHHKFCIRLHENQYKPIVKFNPFQMYHVYLKRFSKRYVLNKYKEHTMDMDIGLQFQFNQCNAADWFVLSCSVLCHPETEWRWSILIKSGYSSRYIFHFHEIITLIKVAYHSNSSFHTKFRSYSKYKR